MKKFLPFIVISLSLSLTVTGPGCKKKESEKQAAAAKLASVGELKVTYVAPNGNTQAQHEYESVVVVFDHPMIPLEELSDEKIEPLIKFQPSFSGKYRWLNPKTLSFSPDATFPYASEITALVPEGTRSFDGYELTKNYSWTFTTVRPRLVYHFPRDQQKWLGLNTEIMLVFNQPIELRTFKEFVSFIRIDNEDNENTVDFKLDFPDNDQLEKSRVKASREEVVLLKPAAPLLPESTYFIELKQGLRGKQGELGMEKSRVFQFETFNKFEFKGLDIPQVISPYEALKLRFTNPVTYKELVSKIKFDPEVEIPDYYFRWEQGESTLWLNLPFEPETLYTLKFSANLEDEFKNKIGKEHSVEFKTNSYPPYISMTTGHGILESYGNLKYPVYAVNADSLILRAANLDKNQLIPLLNQEKVFWSSERLSKNGFFNHTKTVNLNLPKNKREIFPLSLQEFLPSGKGLLFIELDTQLEDKWSRFPKVMLQVTDIGISAKFSPENNLIWITELQTGLPIPEAEIEIRDNDNKIIWKGKSDFEGKAQSPGWKLLGLKRKDTWTKPQLWIFVAKNDDLAFTSSEWGTGVYPYELGISYDWNPEPIQIEGFIFSERGIYRAGEKIQLKGIIREREKGEWKLPGYKQVECIIQDPFYNQVFKQSLALDDYGSFSCEYLSGQEASLGYYQVMVNVPGKTKTEEITTLNSSFRIEAFRPAEFELLLRTEKESYVFDEEYRSEVTANYLFGGAMSGQKLSWNLRLDPIHYSPPGHKGYIFGNEIERWERYGQEESRLISSGETVLDEQGRYIFSTLLKPENEIDSVSATWEATVQGPSRRSVSNRIHTIIHRGEFYIGLKPSSTFLEKGEELSVDIISVKPDGELQPGKDISVSLVKREWHSVRKEEMGGRFTWISEKKDTVLDAKKIRTEKEPIKIRFKPEKAGYYLLIAESKDQRGNVIKTSTYFYMTGMDYVPWKRSDDDIVELIPDAEIYKPGDVAQILVKSPYEKAKALITIEREFILESRVIDIQGSSDKIEIPVLSEYVPNVFVSVLLVQGRTSQAGVDREGDIGKPSFKIGYVDLGVDPIEKNLNINIEKNKDKYSPGEEVTLKLKVKDFKGTGKKSSLSIAVVDIGVLNLIGYQTPDPFSFFYKHKPLSVDTSETRKQVVGQRVWGEKGDEEGGGGAEAAKAMSLLSEVELRGNFKFTAYWNPDIRTDEEGNAEISFFLPDNLTTFRIMAVAQTKDSCFGRSDSLFKVAKPLLLQAALPRFARIYDEFQAGVVVHNYSEEKGEVTLECQTAGITFLGNKTSFQFSLSPGKSKEILFPFKAENPGKAEFMFRAIMGEDEDGLEISLPIVQSRPQESTALFNSINKTTKESIKIPEHAFLDESYINFHAAASALSGLKGSVDYLTKYPYLCLEQRLSSILPYIVGHNIIIDFHLSEMDEKEINDFIQSTLKDIYSYQKENGGFGLWPDSQYDSPFNTCYAVFTLIKAHQKGYKIKNSSLIEAENYLKNILKGRIRRQNYPYSSRSWNTVQCYALYVLALSGQPENEYNDKLFSAKEDLSLFAKTLLLKALYLGRGTLQAQNVLLDDLQNKIKVDSVSAHFEDDEGREGNWIYSSNIRTTSLILQSLLETGADVALIPEIARWIVEKRQAGRWTNTQDNFYVFYALNDFYVKYEKVQPDFKLLVELEGKKILEDTFKHNRQQVSQNKISLESFKPGKTIPLNIKITGEGTLFYETRLTYFPTRKLDPRDEGFTIYKQITDMEGNPLSEIKAGTLAVVTLQIIVPQESLFVMVNDPIPAGLEPINPVFRTESEEEQLQLSQSFDEDNRRWWWQGFNHIEMHDDRVLLFADSLSPGIHIHRFLVRALTYGTFNAPGSKIEKMYAPEVFGRSSEISIKVK